MNYGAAGEAARHTASTVSILLLAIAFVGGGCGHVSDVEVRSFLIAVLSSPPSVSVNTESGRRREVCGTRNAELEVPEARDSAQGIWRCCGSGGTGGAFMGILTL